MISELKSKLANMAKDKEIRKRRTRQQLVLAVTRGDKLDPDQAIATMDSVGITGEELEAECQRLDKRLVWAGTLAKREKAELDLQQANRESAALEAEWKVICEAHEEKVSAIQSRAEVAAALISSAYDAERELFRTATGIDELAEVERIESAMRDLRTQEQALEAKRRTSQSGVSESVVGLNHATATQSPQTAEFQDDIDRAKDFQQRLTSQIQAIVAELAILQGQLDQARAALLRPECI